MSREGREALSPSQASLLLQAKTVCPGRGGKFSRPVKLPCCYRLFSTVVSSDTVFVTLFPTTVETLKDPCIDHLQIDRFGGQLMV